jgi:hypothetical protein
LAQFRHIRQMGFDKENGREEGGGGGGGCGGFGGGGCGFHPPAAPPSAKQRLAEFQRIREHRTMLHDAQQQASKF